MAIGAGSHAVRAYQWETVLLMQFGDFIDQPIVSGVAARAIVAHAHAVHIGMAGYAGILGFVKNQSSVAVFTIGLRVLAFQRKAGFFVSKKFFVGSITPTAGSMAGLAVYFKFFAMWVLGKACYAQRQQNQEVWQSLHSNRSIL